MEVCCAIGMDAHRHKDPCVTSRQLNRALTCFKVYGGDDQLNDPCLSCPLNDRIKIVLKGREVKVAVGINQSHGKL
jgi:hypothetical protein